MDIFATKIGKQDNNADFLYFDESDTALYLKFYCHTSSLFLCFSTWTCRKTVLSKDKKKGVI
jgi:hypothetical protein